MHERLDLDRLLISASYGSEDTFESVGTFWEMDPYIKWLRIDFALEDECGKRVVSIYDEKENATPLGSLFGALILGQQASADEQDLFTLCDNCNGDLLVVASELKSEGIIEDGDALCPNILYIDNLELSGEMLASHNIKEFFEMIPDLVFQYSNIKPDVVVYLIASTEGYYDYQACNTEFDPRSVDGFSPLIYSENGYTLSKSGNLLYGIVGNAF